LADLNSESTGLGKTSALFAKQSKLLVAFGLFYTLGNGGFWRVPTWRESLLVLAPVEHREQQLSCCPYLKELPMPRERHFQPFMLLPVRPYRRG